MDYDLEIQKCKEDYNNNAMHIKGLSETNFKILGRLELLIELKKQTVDTN